MKQLLFSLILIFFINSAYGELTNINEVTDLFDRHIENKDQLLHELKTQNDSAIDNIKSGAGANSIEGINEAESKAGELKNIEETDLENRGREKRASKEYQFYDENELEPNYNKSGNKLHKLDAEDIVNATEESMRKLGKNFLDKLKAVGVDCHTVKGPIHKEPTYYIEVKRENQNNTDYDQFFCEELRNKYDCRDQLDLTCKRFGIRWTHWEDKAMLLDGVWIYQVHMGWFYPLQWTSDRYGLHLREGHPAVQAEMRLHIAANEGVNIENIHEHIICGARGEGNTVHADKNMYAFQVYRVHYKIRRGEKICEEWQEDWTERCAIK